MAAQSHQFTGPFVQGYIRGPRLERLSKDQQALIDVPETWSDNLSKQPRGFINIPPNFLESLREFKAKQLSKTQSNGPASSSGVLKEPHQSTEEEAEGIEVAASVKEASPLSPEAVGIDDGDGYIDDDDESDRPGTQISWSPSPSPPPELKGSPPPSSSQRSQQFFTQMPPEQPLPVTIRKQPVPAFTDFPSSSPGQEDELEIEMPTAALLPGPILPINHGAKPHLVAATPPSAQISIIPCTNFEQQTSSASISEPPAKRPRVMKSIDFSAYEEKHVKTTMRSASLAKQKLVIPKNNPPASHQTSTASSPIVPSTHVTQINSSPIRPATEVTLPTEEQKNAITINGSPPRQARSSPRYVPPSPLVQQTSSLMSSPDSPFLKFTVTYPEYKGSLSDFVKACWYLQTLQKKGELDWPSYAYDDFIRAWCEEFYDYVQNSDEPLPAKEWYINAAENIIFSKHVVTKHNLMLVLVPYPEEVTRARRVVEVQPTASQARSSLAKPTATLEDQISVQKTPAVPSSIAETTGPSFVPIDVPAAHEPELMSQSELRHEPELEIEPECAEDDMKANHQTEPETQAIMFLEDPIPQCISNPSMRPTDFESVDLSLSPKPRKEPQLQARTVPTPASESGSNAIFAPPPSTAGSKVAKIKKVKKRYETKEERSKRWRMFVAKTKPRPSTSMSSIPSSTAPPSAQGD